MKKPELLAPAGDLEKLKYALHYGADAVYIGGNQFGLRANASNFTKEEMIEGIKYAHNLGKKVYVTVNIILHEQEIETLIPYLKELDEIKVDAIIVSDPAIIEQAKIHTNLEIHLSTQQSTLNYEAVEFFKKQGVTRIVLGREATEEEIKEIRKRVDIEIECFIHGAMCASYSGRCVLSNVFTARDANRGGCSQICRWDFKLSDGKKNLQGKKDFTFCTKDLSLLQYIPNMIELGVTSFKIEGRMRSIYYIATVVDIYRRVIDEYMQNKKQHAYNKEYELTLKNCANRDSIPQFFQGTENANWNYYNGREEVSNQDFLGVIKSYDPIHNIATVEQRNYFKIKDTIEIFGPNHLPKTITIDKIIDEENQEIDVVRHPKQIVRIKAPAGVEPMDLIRIKKS